MTCERFLQIKSVLRFDDPLCRDRTDSLALVCSMFGEFNKHLHEFYNPSPYLTIDEQLLEFHGRVKFQQYISSKPGKFGIKFIWICCAESFYMLNCAIYIGKGTIEPNVGITTYSITMHLMEPFLNKGYHLTGDSWFTSLPLVDELRHQKTTYIRTLKNSSHDAPAIANSTKDRHRKDTKIYYDNNGTALISFWDKATKPVLLVDSFHHNISLPEIQNKAATVIEYNQTKSGVDIADKRIRGLSCKRKCHRWPYSIFSNMVDIAGNNACIIFNERHPANDVRRQDQHYNFLKSAAYQLVSAHIQHRIQNDKHLSTSAKEAMKLLGYDINVLCNVPTEVILLEKKKLVLFLPKPY